MLPEYCDKYINKRIWVHRWIAKRKEKKVHHNLFMELSLEDPNRFRRYINKNLHFFNIHLKEKH